jgi:hypothetical protein
MGMRVQTVYVRLPDQKHESPQAISVLIVKKRHSSTHNNIMSVRLVNINIIYTDSKMIIIFYYELLLLFIIIIILFILYYFFIISRYIYIYIYIIFILRPNLDSVISFTN